GGRVTLSTGASASPSATFQWRRNGTNISGATSATLTLDNLAAASAGIYSAAVTDAGGTTISAPAVVGLSANAKTTGLCRVVGADIRHANGNIYDQVLLE